MVKKDLKMRALVAPTPTVIASAYDDDGRADACTLAFYMVSSHIPPCVVIAINATQSRKTLKSILARGMFSVGFPGVDQVREADYLGVESGYKADKLAAIGWSVTEGRALSVPVIDQLQLSFECEVVHTVTVGSHMQITGEVKNIQADEGVLDDNDRVDLEILRPIIYDEEGRTYWELGERAAPAFVTGARLRRELKGTDE